MIRPNTATPPSTCQQKPPRDAVLRDHARIVNEFVGRYLRGRPSADRLDLEHAGTVGLLEAYETWNPSARPFSTHCWHYVHRAVRVELGLPADPRESNPPVVSLAEPTGEGDEHYAETLDGRLVAICWDRHKDNGNPGVEGQAHHPSAHDPEDEINTALDAARVHAAIEAADLTATERLVLQALYFEGRRAAGLATELNVSAARVSQIKASALRKLREVLS